MYYANNKYYTDAELTTEVTPAGVMLSWDDKEVTEDYEHWTNAVWKVLNFDSTQALLTRKEELDLNDQGILKYNTDTHQADTLPLPNKPEQTLTSTSHETTETVSAVKLSNGKYYKSDTMEEVTLSAYTEIPGDYGDDYWLYDDVWYVRYYNTSSMEYDEHYRDLAGNIIEDAEILSHLDNDTYVGSADSYGNGTIVTASGFDYIWKDKQAGTYVFTTMDDYNRVADTIPVGSQIIIEDETDYVYGDEING